jgi:hypothetical protein
VSTSGPLFLGAERNTRTRRLRHRPVRHSGPIDPAHNAWRMVRTHPMPPAAHRARLLFFRRDGREGAPGRRARDPTDTITLTGHGSNSAMTYSAKELAALLATRGLKNKKNAHIEVLGCRTGQDFRETLLKRLQFKHAVSTGSSVGSSNVVFMDGGVPTTLSNSAQDQYDLASVFGETAYQSSILQDNRNHVPLGSGPEWKSGASPLIDM